MEKPDYVSRLAELVYRKRVEQRGRGVRQAAKEAGLSPSTISRMECGKVPDVETFRKLCLWLDVSADELLGLKKEKEA